MKQMRIASLLLLTAVVVLCGCSTKRAQFKMDVLLVDIPKDGVLAEDILELMMPFELNSDSGLYSPAGNLIRLGDTLSYEKPLTWRESIRKKISLNTTVFLAREDVKAHISSLSVSKFSNKSDSLSVDMIRETISGYDAVVVYAPAKQHDNDLPSCSTSETLRVYLVDSILQKNPQAQILCIIGWPPEIRILKVEEAEQPVEMTHAEKPISKVKQTVSEKREDVSHGGAVSAKPELKFYTLVPQMPTYPGGQDALSSYVSKNIVYPNEAKNQGITGTVYVSYVVDASGRATDVRLVKGVHPLLNNEAIRVIKTLSGFAPGRKDGKVVPVQLNQLVRFPS